MSETAKSRTPRVWHIVEWATRYEMPPTKKGRKETRQGPMPFVRRYIIGQTEEAAAALAAEALLKQFEDWVYLQGAWWEIVRRAASLRREYRGYLLDDQLAPAGAAAIAQWLCCDRAAAERMLRKLERAGLLEHVKCPDFLPRKRKIYGTYKAKSRGSRGQKPNVGGPRRGEAGRGGARRGAAALNGNNNKNQKDKQKEKASSLRLSAIGKKEREQESAIEREAERPPEASHSNSTPAVSTPMATAHRPLPTPTTTPPITPTEADGPSGQTPTEVDGCRAVDDASTPGPSLEPYDPAWFVPDLLSELAPQFWRLNETEQRREYANWAAAWAGAVQTLLRAKCCRPDRLEALRHNVLRIAAKCRRHYRQTAVAIRVCRGLFNREVAKIVNEAEPGQPLSSTGS